MESTITSLPDLATMLAKQDLWEHSAAEDTEN